MNGYLVYDVQIKAVRQIVLLVLYQKHKKYVKLAT